MNRNADFFNATSNRPTLPRAASRFHCPRRSVPNLYSTSATPSSSTSPHLVLFARARFGFHWPEIAIVFYVYISEYRRRACREFSKFPPIVLQSDGRKRSRNHDALIPKRSNGTALTGLTENEQSDDVIKSFDVTDLPILIHYFVLEGMSQVKYTKFYSSVYIYHVALSAAYLPHNQFLIHLLHVLKLSLEIRHFGVQPNTQKNDLAAAMRINTQMTPIFHLNCLPNLTRNSLRDTYPDQDQSCYQKLLTGPKLSRRYCWNIAAVNFTCNFQTDTKEEETTTHFSCGT